MVRELNDVKENILESYYANGQKKLRRLVEAIAKKYGVDRVEHKDMDEYYSIAGIVLADIIYKFDETKDVKFDTYFYGCVERKIKQFFTKENREKRKADKNSIPIDKPIDESGENTIGDTIPSDYCLEDEVMGTVLSTEMTEYLNSLSRTQRKIAELIMFKGLNFLEIKEELGLDDNKFNRLMDGMKSFQKMSILSSLINNN